MRSWDLYSKILKFPQYKLLNRYCICKYSSYLTAWHEHWIHETSWVFKNRKWAMRSTERGGLQNKSYLAPFQYHLRKICAQSSFDAIFFESVSLTWWIIACQNSSGPSVTAEKNKEVHDLFRSNPRVSVRDAEQQTGVSKFAVHQSTRQALSALPYKLQTGSVSLIKDKQARVQFDLYDVSKVEAGLKKSRKVSCRDECS